MDTIDVFWGIYISYFFAFHTAGIYYLVVTRPAPELSVTHLPPYEGDHDAAPQN